MGPPGAQANQCETPCSDACNGSPTRRTQEVTCRSPTPESRRLSRPLSLPLSLSLSLPLPLPLPLPLSLRLSLRRRRRRRGRRPRSSTSSSIVACFSCRARALFVMKVAELKTPWEIKS